MYPCNRTLMRLLLVYNPVSGAGAGAAAAAGLIRTLAHKGHAVEQCPTQRGDATTWLTPTLDDFDALLVMGGDGTVRSVVALAAAAGVPLVHVPLGTENLLARGLGMQADPAAVCRTLDEGEVRPIDLAEVNGEPMLLMASVGLDADIVQWVTANRADSISKWIYARAAWACLRGYEAPVFDVEVDGTPMVQGGRGWLVVANSPDYGGRIDPAPNARLNNGLLDVVFLPARGAGGMLGWGAAAWLRAHLTRRSSLVRQGAHVQVTLAQPTRMQLDGDPPHDRRAVTSMDIRLHPNTLKVICPPWASGFRAWSPQSTVS